MIVQHPELLIGQVWEPLNIMALAIKSKVAEVSIFKGFEVAQNMKCSHLIQKLHHSILRTDRTKSTCPIYFYLEDIKVRVQRVVLTMQYQFHFHFHFHYHHQCIEITQNAIISHDALLTAVLLIRAVGTMKYPIASLGRTYTQTVSALKLVITTRPLSWDGQWWYVPVIIFVLIYCEILCGFQFLWGSIFVVLKKSNRFVCL